MNLLAIDGAFSKASVVVISAPGTAGSGATIRAGALVPTQGGLASALLFHIDAVLKKAHLSTNTLTGIACGVGPGSFTGIRVAAATAQSLGQALNIPVVGFSSLEWLAQWSSQPGGAAAVWVDAQQNEVYHGYRNLESGVWVDELCADDNADNDARNDARDNAGNGLPSATPLDVFQGAALESIDAAIRLNIIEFLSKLPLTQSQKLAVNYLKLSAAQKKLAGLTP